MPTQRRPSRILAPQAHSACSAACPTAHSPHALPIAHLALLHPLLRPPILLSVAHRGRECIAAVYMLDRQSAVVETIVSVMTWLSIARHQVLNACQNVRSAKTGWRRRRLAGLWCSRSFPNDHDIPAHVTRTSLHMQDVHYLAPINDIHTLCSSPNASSSCSVGDLPIASVLLPQHSS
jgi:hypothetical protein